MVSYILATRGHFQPISDMVEYCRTLDSDPATFCRTVSPLHWPIKCRNMSCLNREKKCQENKSYLLFLKLWCACVHSIILQYLLQAATFMACVLANVQPATSCDKDCGVMRGSNTNDCFCGHDEHVLGVTSPPPMRSYHHTLQNWRWTAISPPCNTIPSKIYTLPTTQGDRGIVPSNTKKTLYGQQQSCKLWMNFPYYR